MHVTFSELMGAGVLNAANYAISGDGMGTVSVNPDSVSLISGNVYRLLWNAGSIDATGDITITVTGVEDLAGNPIGTNNSGVAPAVPTELSTFEIE